MYHFSIFESEYKKHSILKFEKFVAKRLHTAKNLQHTISKPIMRMAITAVSLSIIIMTLAIATGKGLQEKISAKVTGFTSDIQISNFDLNQSAELKPIEVNQLDLAAYQNSPLIKNIQVQITKNALIKSDEEFEGIIVKGVGDNYSWDFLKEHIVDGDIPIYQDNSKSNEILISSKLANKLKLGIKDKALFYFQSKMGGNALIRKLTISGIYNTGINLFDDVFVIADIKQLQKINKWDNNQVATIELNVNNKDKLNEAFEFANQQSSFDHKVQTAQQLYPQIFDWIKLFDLNIAVVLLIMILVASINMISSLLIIILERTKMIGLLKALGAQNYSLKKIFLFHAFYLLKRALIIGNSVSIAIILIQTQFELITLNPTHYYVRTLPLSLSFESFLLINLGTIVICMCVLSIPALLIHKIEPVRALNYE